MSAPLVNLLRDGRIDLILSRIDNNPLIIEEVIEQLNSNIRSIRFNSILILGKLGEKSKPAIPNLAACLEDNDWSICRETVRSLGNLGNLSQTTVTKLVELINNEEVSIRREVATAIGNIGYSSAESISSLIILLADSDEDVRIEAANSLGSVGFNSSEAVSNLAIRLNDVSWKVRTAAAISLGKIGIDSKEAIPILINSLKDKDWRVRNRAVNSLANFREKAVPNLLIALDQEKKLVKRGIIEVFGEMKIDDPKIIEALTPLLTKLSVKIRGAAIEALRDIGKSSIPSLIGALIQSSNKRRILLIAALGTMEDDITDKIPLIIENLEKINILRSKKQIKDINRSGLPLKLKLKWFLKFYSDLIISFLNDVLMRKTLVRVEISRMLGKIGKNSDLAIKVLIDALSDIKNFVRRASALALGELGESAKSAIPNLIDLLNDPVADVRWRAAESLGKIRISTPEVISGLEALMSDTFDHVSMAAEVALDKIKRNQ